MTNLYERELLPDHVTTVKSAAIGHEHREYLTCPNDLGYPTITVIVSFYFEYTRVYIYWNVNDFRTLLS